ncbi:MAG: four helix bundle protein [Chitinispirillales bacterium]|jgi:hypothetical protein|nr:four helix bundle protein [Chitinispirillales bacterium]
MKTEDILLIEESGENLINLVRDRLFWQAWNRSAFLFVTHIKKYRVHKRFIQKVAQDVAWLGFPKTAVAQIENAVRTKGWSFEHKNADHITIGGIPQTNGYEKWWVGVVKPPKVIVASAEAKDKPGKLKEGQPQLLPAYKAAYDLCLSVYKATAKIPKEYRYELGTRVRNYATDIAEELHLMSNAASGAARQNAGAGAITGCADIIHRLRIDVRILHDLRLIGVNQWGFLNQQIEDLLELLRAEFRKRV